MKVLQIDNLTLSRNNKILLNQANLSLNIGEHLFITGDAGTGKTSLGLAIAGKLFYSGNIISIYPFSEICFVPQFYKFKSKSGVSDFYYQQRYNSYDSEDSLTVKELLDSKKINYDMIEELFFTSKLNSSLLHLSSGERKKLQLIEALNSNSKIIILDNPFIGLDSDSVDALNKLLSRLSKQGITFIILADTSQIPEFVTHIATISELKLITQLAESYKTPQIENIIVKTNLPEIKPLNCKSIINLKNITIKYGTKVILDQINWEVAPGEKWLLHGPNGAGKSTLLSLVNGDHPQSYINEIYLFDQRRGSGESIWDIKRKIGFVSPELHWNFDYSTSCLNIVATGIYDTLGLFKTPKPEELELASKYIELLGLQNYKDQNFNAVSTGIQRMILLGRALVKNPPLLIFDEPCQGLDTQHANQFIQILDSLFSDSNHTLIFVSHVNTQIPKCISKTFKLSRQ